MKSYKNKMGKFYIVLITVLSLVGMPFIAFAEEIGNNQQPSASPPPPTGSPSPTPTISPGPTAKPEIKLDQTRVELTVGESVIIKATVTGVDVKDVVWSSTNVDVAKVDSDGKVTAIAEGEADIKAESTASGVIATCKVVVKEKAPEVPKPDDVEKSSDTTLKSLSVKNGTIRPNFDPNVREYTLVVLDGKDPQFTYVRNHSKQDVKMPNTTNLKNGSIINISVTAEDGKQQAYKFTIEKEGTDSLDLKLLKIKGYTLNEPFSSSKTGYTVDIPYEAEDVVVEVETASPNVKTTVRGATNLRVGSNTVTVTVKDDDGNTKVYTITVTRSAKEDEKDGSDEESSDLIVSQRVSNSNSLKVESTRKNHTLEYVLVSIGCLILFAIGVLGIFFYIKTSNRDKKDKKVSKGKPIKEELEEKVEEKLEEKDEVIETPMVEVKSEDALEDELGQTIEFTELVKSLEDRKKSKEAPKASNVLKEIEDLFDDE